MRNNPCRIVYIEGDDRHAERVSTELNAAGMRSIRRVASREDYLALLREFWPDVIVVGGGAPRLPVAAALELAQREAPFLPVVFEEGGPLTALADAVLAAVMLAREARDRHIAAAAARHARLGAERLWAERTGDVTPLSVLIATGPNPGYLH